MKFSVCHIREIDIPVLYSRNDNGLHEDEILSEFRVLMELHRRSVAAIVAR